MPIYEDFLSYVWQFKLFNQLDLKTSDGYPVKILSNGYINKDAGPDFENVKLIIGDTEWIGNVEIHVRSSDWDRHHHSSDKAYNNVILHVVYEHDKDVYRNDGTVVPVLAIKPYIHPGIEDKYKLLTQNLNWIPCESHIATFDGLHFDNWLLRMLIERLERKAVQLEQTLAEYKGSWDDAFYITLARNFGFKTNALPFEMLARSLPQQILARHKNNALQIEALIFGQAGFLEDPNEDAYHRQLRIEYKFLQSKYQLKPIDKFLWKFLRLRPQNFPTLRLAQFSALVLKSNHLFSKVLEIRNFKDFEALFEDFAVSPYWLTHYRFNKEAAKVSIQPGGTSISNILLNSVSLTLFTYGKYTGDGEIQERALNLIAALPFEQNKITRKFLEIGVRKGNADRSQALLHLKREYCDLKKCLNCALGMKIVHPN